MKRLHVHISVDDLAQSTRFYATLFAAEPTVVKDDYVKWMLDDPRVNFAISAPLPGAPPESRISAFKPSRRLSWLKSMTGSLGPSVRS
jgi:hypothetical protein